MEDNSQQRYVKIKEFYSKASKLDHQMMYYHHKGKLDKDIEIVLAEMQRRQFDTEKPVTLDVGCSIGRYEKTLVNKGHRTVGIDVASSPLIEAHTNVPEANFVIADVMNLPFQNQKFDLVLCIELLHHFTDVLLEKLLDEVTRVIKPGGYFFFDVKNKLNPLLFLAYKRNDSVSYTLKARTPKSLERNLRKRGFRINSKKGSFFPIVTFAPYVIIVAWKEASGQKE